jgi:hypothetical protein
MVKISARRRPAAIFGGLTDQEFVATLPRKIFVANGKTLRVTSSEAVVIAQATRLQRQGLISMKPDAASKGGAGYFCDLALTQLGRTTFGART